MPKFVIYFNYFVATLNFINAGCSLALGDYFRAFSNLLLGILFISLTKYIKKV